MAGWVIGPDGLLHLWENPRTGLGTLSTDSACGLPELGRAGEGAGADQQRCRDCVELVATMEGAG